MTKPRTFTVTLPSQSKRRLKRPARIYDKDNVVVFEGSNETAETIFAKMLKASGAFEPPTKEEATALRKEKRRQRFIY